MSSDESPTEALTHAEKAYAFFWHGRRKLLGWPALIIGVVLLGFGLRLNDRIAGRCDEFHFAVQLSGSPRRLDWILRNCYQGPAPLGAITDTTLFWDDLSVIAGVLIAATLVLSAGWWRFEADLMRKAWWVLYLPAAVALLDVLEDSLLVWLLKSGNPLQLGHPWPAKWILTTVAYTKWALVLATVIAVVLALAVTAARWNERFPPPRRRREAHPSVTSPTARHLTTVATEDPAGKADQRRAVDRAGPADDPELGPPDEGGVPTAPSETERGVVGVCVSGGGIRATAFALGVLRQLDVPPEPAGEDAATRGRADDGKSSPLAKARYLSAVSGGAWAATAWTLRKAAGNNSVNAADAVITALQHDVPSGYQRQKYLMNGRGGVLGPLWWVLFCAFVNLSFIGSLIYLVAWPLGWFESRCAVSGAALGPSLSCPPARPDDVIPDGHVLSAPTVVFAIAGVVVLIVCGGGFKRFVGGWRIGALTARAVGPVWPLSLCCAMGFRQVAGQCVHMGHHWLCHRNVDPDHGGRWRVEAYRRTTRSRSDYTARPSAAEAARRGVSFECNHSGAGRDVLLGAGSVARLDASHTRRLVARADGCFQSELANAPRHLLAAAAQVI